ncbi:MAG: condensation domain-containing protein, partial [Solirubrobacterales bacterium]
GHDAGLPAEIERLDAEALAQKGGEPVPCAPGGDRLAYVLFTSGSTGRPKGVEVTHRNIVHFVCSGSDLIARGDDVALHVVPLGFDISGHEIWGALANGARLVIAPPGRPDPAELGRLIADRGVTILTISAGLLHELVHAALPDLGGVRLIASGGDVLSPTAVVEMRRTHPSVRLLNSYGPTEATIAATSFEVAEVDGEPVPIGRALSGYRLRVLDEDGEPVPAGDPGELWIGGAGVARGYRNDPERTAAAFVPDPAGGRMYRTGDRVRLRADGELLFLGRLDDQVKISSQRVEPGEVEHVLASHPSLRTAAVVAREDVPGHKHLVGYAVPNPGTTPQPQELRNHVAERLPAFMVPNTIVLLDALPLNERGKVERSALPAPSRGQLGESAGSEDPIAKLMAEVLQLDSVGPDENFFELGGSSLLAIQLVGRLREQLDLPADIGAVFEAPTPSALSELLAGQGEPAPALPPLRPGPSRATAPLSAAQRRAWLFCRMNPDSIAYQFAVIFQLEGQLDRNALEGALADLLRRHEILRTSFEERDGEPVAVIHDERQPCLDVVDLRGEKRDAWSRLVRACVRTQIDPGDAPLVHWTLVRLDEDRWRLIHAEHHLIHDGWSFAVLAGELAELYSARAEERAPDLAPAVQFQDYARWEQLVLEGPAVQRQVDHWARVLDPDPPLLQLPGERPRPARESFAGGSVRRRLDADLAAHLRALAHENGATLFMVTLAAFLTQLRRYSGRDDLQIGSGLANRRDPNSERTIGMTVNTVGLRCDLGGDPDVRELLARVRRTALDAYANADAPFDAVVRAVGARRDPTRSPLIQTLFSFHDAPRTDERWQGLNVRLVQGIPNGTGKADLNVIGVAEGDGGMTFLWEHSELLSDAAADRLAGHHLRLLEQFAARPDARLSELDLLSEEERTELRAWNAPGGSYDREATLPGLVGAQAGRTPEATAVLDGAQRLTYA